MFHRNASLLGCMLLLFIKAALVAGKPALDSVPLLATTNNLEETDKLPDTKIETNSTPAAALNTANSNANDTNKESTGFGDSQETTAPGDNVASASNIDPSSIYASGLITPEAFQHYLSQYGAYAPYAGAYPAPMAAAPGLYPYPGPIVVQSGYEGFLVPTTAATTTTISATDVSSTTAATTSSNPLLAFISNLLPTILMSTLFRIAAVLLSAVGVILFGGAITNGLCRLTPLCDVPNKAVEYLRSGGAEDVGRMLAEEMTPERVRRATEFVRNAIRKYRQLQKFADAKSD